MTIIMMIKMLKFSVFHACCHHCKNSLSVDDCDTLKSIVSLLWAIIIFAVIAALTSLAGAILGCIGTCCRVRTAIDLFYCSCYLHNFHAICILSHYLHTFHAIRTLFALFAHFSRYSQFGARCQMIVEQLTLFQPVK